MSGIDQQLSFHMTLDGVHALHVKEHSMMGDAFKEFGYVTFEATNIHNKHPQRLTIWFDNRHDEDGQSALTIGDIGQFGLALAQWANDRRMDTLNKAEAELKEISDA